MRETLLALTISALCVSSMTAQQIIEVAGDGTITGDISTTGITRLQLIGDEVASVHINDGGQHTEVSFVKEPSTGDLYLKLSDQNSSNYQYPNIDFFLTTKKGYTYQAKLKISPNATSQIIVRNLQIALRNHNLKRTNQKLEDTVIGLVRAMSNGVVLDGYKVKKPKSKTRALGSLRFHTQSIYVGEHLTGQVLIVSNPTPGNVSVNERKFLTSGILAVSILGNHRLKSTETTKVLLVGHTNGESLL